MLSHNTSVYCQCRRLVMSWDIEVHDFIVSLNKYNDVFSHSMPLNVKTVNKSHNS